MATNEELEQRIKKLEERVECNAIIRAELEQHIVQLSNENNATYQYCVQIARAHNALCDALVSMSNSSPEFMSMFTDAIRASRIPNPNSAETGMKLVDDYTEGRRIVEEREREVQKTVYNDLNKAISSPYISYVNGDFDTLTGNGVHIEVMDDDFLHIQVMDTMIEVYAVETEAGSAIKVNVTDVGNAVSGTQEAQDGVDGNTDGSGSGSVGALGVLDDGNGVDAQTVTGCRSGVDRGSAETVDQQLKRFINEQDERGLWVEVEVAGEREGEGNLTRNSLIDVANAVRKYLKEAQDESQDSADAVDGGGKGRESSKGNEELSTTEQGDDDTLAVSVDAQLEALRDKMHSYGEHTPIGNCVWDFLENNVRPILDEWAQKVASKSADTKAWIRNSRRWEKRAEQAEAEVARLRKALQKLYKPIARSEREGIIQRALESEGK